MISMQKAARGRLVEETPVLDVLLLQEGWERRPAEWFQAA
jgi:hypothetical protein